MAMRVVCRQGKEGAKHMEGSGRSEEPVRGRTGGEDTRCQTWGQKDCQSLIRNKSTFSSSVQKFSYFLLLICCFF